MVCCIMIKYDEAHTMSTQWHISRTRRNELDAVHATPATHLQARAKVNIDRIFKNHQVVKVFFIWS